MLRRDLAPICPKKLWQYVTSITFTSIPNLNVTNVHFQFDTLYNDFYNHHNLADMLFEDRHRCPRGFGAHMTKLSVAFSSGGF